MSEDQPANTPQEPASSPQQQPQQEPAQPSSPPPPPADRDIYDSVKGGGDYIKYETSTPPCSSPDSETKG